MWKLRDISKQARYFTAQYKGGPNGTMLKVQGQWSQENQADVRVWASGAYGAAEPVKVQMSPIQFMAVSLWADTSRNSDLYSEHFNRAKAESRRVAGSPFEYLLSLGSLILGRVGGHKKIWMCQRRPSYIYFLSSLFCLLLFNICPFIFFPL